MVRLDINFVAPAKPGPWAWGLVAMLACAAAGAAWKAASLQDDLARQQALAARASSEQKVQVQAPPARPAAPYDEAARSFMRHAQWPWPTALAALEGNLTAGVTLSALELSATDGLVRLEVRAPSYDLLLRWLQEQNLQSEGLNPACWQWTLTEATYQPGGEIWARVQGRCASQDL
ncbi:hypothetical protein [Ideonella paludis]|uniref:PilN domain-containing protein n=1 Tax=Ideonella paludis TaxID=1233411 RepID=A0ABS5DVB9_9BURK|nr:hypothetical protein [Ideonella paludis]MBQ0935090.1 hypothetical protein [Ideonella paludis]